MHERIAFLDRLTLGSAALLVLSLAGPLPAAAAPKDQCAQGVAMFNKVKADPGAYDPDQGLSKDSIRLQLNHCMKYMRELKMKSVSPGQVVLDEPKTTYEELDKLTSASGQAEVLGPAHRRWLSGKKERKAATEKGKREARQAEENEAAASQSVGEVRNRCGGLISDWNGAKQASENGKPAKGFYEASIKDAVGKCRDAVEGAKAAGTAASDPIQMRQGNYSLEELETLLARIERELPALAANLQKQKKGRLATQDAEWETNNIMGGAMRKVYEDKGKVFPSTRKAGTDVVWTYRSHTSGAVWHECEDYVFSSSGKLKDQKKYRCE